MTEETPSYDLDQETRQGDWMQTASGRAFYWHDIRAEDIVLTDIAHGLSNLSRFTGQCRRFYSVAEHSVHVAQVLIKYSATPNPMLALAGLFHDAHEAYLGDMSRPFKQMYPEVHKLQDTIQNAIEKKYGIVNPPPCVNVKWVDNVMLHTEMKQLMAFPPKPWAPLPAPLPDYPLPCWTPEEAKTKFLVMYAHLKQELVG